MHYQRCWNECRNHQVENKGWLHHNQDILLPLIKIRDGILIQYHTVGKGKGDTPFTKQRIHNKQQQVNYAIALGKSN